MNQQLLIKKDRECATLRSQVQSLSDELNRTSRMLRDREQENHRISQSLADLRDAAIQRDLELTAVKQDLGARQADAFMTEAQQRNAAHAMKNDLEALKIEVEEERAKRSA